jgi:hypothetical protein
LARFLQIWEIYQPSKAFFSQTINLKAAFHPNLARLSLFVSYSWTEINYLVLYQVLTIEIRKPVKVSAYVV